MIRALALLTRPRLALLNGVTAVAGYLLFPAEAHVTVLLAAFCGVALLAAGGSAINQVMEQDIDRLMERTRLRPLPRGQMTPAAATIIGGSMITGGLTLLGTVGGAPPALLGAGALLWYLALYTPLKRRTSFALMIGALCGAIPPLIGWCLAGGRLTDFRIMLLACLLYLWQIPHFWLLQRRHADDYRAAGIPLCGASGQNFGYPGVWIMALIAMSMLLPALGITGSHLSIWYALLPLPLVLLTLLRLEKALFTYLNLFPLLLTLALVA